MKDLIQVSFDFGSSSHLIQINKSLDVKEIAFGVLLGLSELYSYDAFTCFNEKWLYLEYFKYILKKLHVLLRVNLLYSEGRALSSLMEYFLHLLALCITALK